MKRGLWLFLTISLVAALIAAMLPAAGLAEDKVFKWRMVSLYPRGFSFGVTFPPFCERVKAMSNGRLQIEMVYEGEGVEGGRMFEALKSGLVEMGRPYMALHAGEMPAGVVGLGLPGGPTNYAELMALSSESGWSQVLQKAYDRHGLVLLGEAYQPGPYLLTKKPT